MQDRYSLGSGLWFEHPRLPGVTCEFGKPRMSNLDQLIERKSVFPSCFRGDCTWKLNYFEERVLRSLPLAVGYFRLLSQRREQDDG